LIIIQFIHVKRNTKGTNPSCLQSLPSLRFLWNTPPLHQLQIQWNYSISQYLTTKIASLKRAIAPFNPFALQQVPTTDSIGFGVKFGERWWQPEVLKTLFSLIPQE
jgi:hypothetical protein